MASDQYINGTSAGLDLINISLSSASFGGDPVHIRLGCSPIRQTARTLCRFQLFNFTTAAIPLVDNFRLCNLNDYGAIKLIH